MSEPTDSRMPRGNGAAPDGAPGARGLRHWMRRLFRPRNGGDSLRDSIEELIEQGEAEDSGETDELVLVRNILQLGDLSSK